MAERTTPATATPDQPTAGSPEPSGPAWSRAWWMLRHRQLPPSSFRWVSGLAVWALAFIIVTGSLVRLTGSGLGCKDWPTCSGHQVVAPWQFHAWVEFGNRLVTGLVSIATVLAVLGALLRQRRRRDLTLLSLGLVAGVLAEIVLGGLTVEHKLAPQFVTAHFLLAVVFLADAVVLHHRAGLPDEPVAGRPGKARTAGPARPLVSGWTRTLGYLLVPAAALVVSLGTVVTSTGPHGGDPSARRYGFSLHSVAQLHGSSVEAFLGLTILTVWGLSRGGAPRPVMVRAEVLLAVLIAQGAVGYLQYFTGVPAALVAIHVVGAVALVVATLHFALGLTAHPEADGAAGRLATPARLPASAALAG